MNKRIRKSIKDTILILSVVIILSVIVFGVMNLFIWVSLNGKIFMAALTFIMTIFGAAYSCNSYLRD